MLPQLQTGCVTCRFGLSEHCFPHREREVMQCLLSSGAARIRRDGARVGLGARSTGPPQHSGAHGLKDGRCWGLYQGTLTQSQESGWVKLRWKG